MAIKDGHKQNPFWFPTKITLLLKEARGFWDLINIMLDSVLQILLDSGDKFHYLSFHKTQVADRILLRRSRKNENFDHGYFYGADDEPSRLSKTSR
jgi:hypothetical protein